MTPPTRSLQATTGPLQGPVRGRPEADTGTSRLALAALPGGAAASLDSIGTSGRRPPAGGAQDGQKTEWKDGSGSPGTEHYVQVEKPPSKRRKSYIDACESGDWTLVLGDLTTGEVKRLAYKCKSWRHTGPCAQARNAQDFARINAALERHPIEDIVYLVVTFPQRGRTVRQGYEALAAAWPKLRKRLVREYGPIEYVGVAEEHRTGWPHMNLILVNAQLGRACQGDGWKIERKRMLPHLQACGFGVQRWLEPARSRGSLAGYLTKLAASFGSTVGEVAKLSQVPLTAPPGFRRLRSSRGFLPSKPKDKNITGWIAVNSTGLPLRPLNDVQLSVVPKGRPLDPSILEQLEDAIGPPLSLTRARPSSAAADCTPRASLLLGAAAKALNRSRVDVGRVRAPPGCPSRPFRESSPGGSPTI